jgi:D-arabinitol dehydrogenase (NADP+)
MKAVVYDVPEQFDVRDVADRDLVAGEARLELLAVGMCGSDVHLHRGENYPAYPLTPGHEMVARVVEVAYDVSGVVAGDLVAVDNVRYCMECERCQEGAFNFCLNRRSMGTKLPGGFAQRAIAPAAKCYPIGDLPLEQAVLVEPTACAIHGVGLIGDVLTKSILIAGAGPSALILAQLLRAGGARRVTVAAPTAAKLALAEELAATETVRVERSDFAASDGAFRALEPLGYDVTVDATGSPGVMAALVTLTKSGGQLMIYGMAAADASLSIHPFEVFRRQLRIQGSFAQVFDFGRAIHALASGAVSSRGMITHRFGLDQYADALEAVRSPDCVKAVVEPNGPVLA